MSLGIDVTPALLAASAFLATNIDDFFLLMGFFADRERSVKAIVLGQFLGMAAITLAAILVAGLAFVVPQAWVGAFGLIPIALGLRALWMRRREQAENERRFRSLGTVFTVALVTVANGGDNLGVFVPLFATQTRDARAEMLATFAAMTGLWCAGARWMSRHPLWGTPLRRHGHAIMPFLLIGLGILILLRRGR